MQNKMLQNSICDSERSEIPKDFFGKLREDPAQPGERDRPRRGDPAALPTPRRENRGKDSGEKEGGSDIRAALPRGLRGYPHSDALHPIYVFRNAFLTCFFKKSK